MNHPHGQDPRRLIFDWQDREHRGLRMGFALTVTAACIVLLFIVFRVVTPDSRPLEVRPQSVLVLNPKVPEERALINQAMDRSFGLLPTEPMLTAQIPGLRMPDYVPSYASHELRLKPMPSGVTSLPQTRSFALEMDILPELPPMQVSEAPSSPPVNVLRAVIEGPLAARVTGKLVISDTPLLEMSRPQFQIGVGRLGQVVIALPLSVSDDPEIQQKLHHSLTQLRFSLSEKELEWAQVSFRWEREDAP